jgi:hypothetical protein
VEEETGRCTPRDRHDRGPGTQGRIRRDNVGKVSPAAGADRAKRLWLLGGAIGSAVVGHRADMSRTHEVELS